LEGRKVDDLRVKPFVNALFDDRRRAGYALVVVIFSAFLIIAGFLYSLGKPEGGLIFLGLAILLSIYCLGLVIFIDYLFIPREASFSDDGVILHYSGKRSRNVKWSEIRTLGYDNPIKSVRGKKKGDVIRLVLDNKKILVIVDNTISDMLKKGYRDWVARAGRTENIAIGRRTPVNQIIAGEVNKRRGAATIAFGVAWVLVVVIVAHITVGLSYLPFAMLVLILAFSGLGFFVLFGVAELLGDSGYLKLAIVIAIGGLISVSTFLTVATLRLEFLFTMVLAFALIVYAYFLVWRKLAKKGSESG
jgi:hypothetical protein